MHLLFCTLTECLRQIIECRFLRIYYESKVTWKMVTDYLRCSPDFHGKPRYDSAIVDAGAGRLALVKLHFAFILEYGNKRYPLALVQPTQTPARTSRAPVRAAVQQDDIDHDLALCRVKAKKTPVFVPLRAIVRGALLYPDPVKKDEYLAVDTIETGDMFLRLKEMFPNRSLA